MSIEISHTHQIIRMLQIYALQTLISLDSLSDSLVNKLKEHVQLQARLIQSHFHRNIETL